MPKERASNELVQNCLGFNPFLYLKLNVHRTQRNSVEGKEKKGSPTKILVILFLF